MGARGPIPRSAAPRHSQKRAPAPVATLVPPSAAPVTPETLSPAGVELWSAIWRSAPWLRPDLDGPSVEEYVTVLADLARFRRLIAEAGEVLVEPIVTPKGSIVGERLVAHPLLRELRRVERRGHELAASLGLTPTSRARLGIVLLRAEEKRSKLEELMERRSQR